MRLMLATVFRKRYFDQEKPPDLRTIKRWVREGVVLGRVITSGKQTRVYIDAEAWERAPMTRNALADKLILRHGR